MVNTAVILAAGLGSRLGDRTKEQPKSLLKIDDTMIIERSITRLLESGISNIIIGTGYKSEAFEQMASKYSQICCVYNPNYQITGSMYTLYNLKDYIKEDFLLLESDLIYEKAALDILIYHSDEDVILASELTYSHDEVFIETDKSGFLKNISKQKENLISIYGELVGITKISLSTYKKMCIFTEKMLEKNPKLDYEQCLLKISNQCSVKVHKVKDLLWCEIDDEVHLQRAINEIYPGIKAKENKHFLTRKNILLNPGPASTTESVKYAQIMPDICPREKEFGEVMKFISISLIDIAANTKEYTSVLFGGSGTAGVEAVVSSVVGDGSILIINNGAYGKRMCQIAEAYGINYIEFKSPSDEAVDISLLEGVIKKYIGKLSHLAVVHNETTTGLLSDIALIGEICKRYSLDLIVDAMSSFAAVPIDMKNMNISFLISSANKNLQGMPGVAFVIANKEKLEDTQSLKPRNLYLNLYSQYKYFTDTLQLRFTPPVQTIYALRQAIIETIDEGVERRYERYKKSWETLINGITKLGLSHLVKEEHHSKIITAILEPSCNKYNFNEMHDYFYNMGITIYPGKLGDLNTFRIANIGNITYKDIEFFTKKLEEYLYNIEYKK